MRRRFEGRHLHPKCLDFEGVTLAPGRGMETPSVVYYCVFDKRVEIG